MSFDVSTLVGRRATDVSHRLSMGDLLRRVSRSMPDRIALVGDAGASETGGPVRITYEEAADLVDRAAEGFQRAGLRPGDICVLVCENSVEALLTKIAVARAGAVVAPLNPSLADDVVERLVNRLQPKAFVTETALLPRFTGDDSPVNGLLMPFVIDVGGSDGTAGEIAQHNTFAEFSAAHSGEVEEPAIAGDDIWQLLFTSGSTSDPKAAMVSHTNTYIEALSWTATLSRGLQSENDTVVGTGLPMVYHVGDAMAYASWFNSGTVVLARKPDPHGIAQLIGQEKITTLWGGLPQFLRNLLNAFDSTADYDMGSLRTVIFGWAPLDRSTFERYQEHADHEISFAAIIGQTELVVSHRFWLNEHKDLLSSDDVSPNYIGLPHAALGASVFDIEGDGGVVTEHGDMGEVRYQSPALMAGYYKDEAATAQAIKDGWFHSGDVFGIGANSQRIMLDRLKDVIKSGGENVSSLRVEAALETHEAVERAAVIGVQDQRWGEAVTAIVVLKDGAQSTEQSLIDYCKERLARFEVPKAVKFVETLPMSVGGKLQKFKLTEIAQR